MDAWNEKQTRVEELLPLILEQLAAGQTVKFAPYGVSMLPMLRQGVDTVVLSPVPGKPSGWTRAYSVMPASLISAS